MGAAPATAPDDIRPTPNPVEMAKAYTPIDAGGICVPFDAARVPYVPNFGK